MQPARGRHSQMFFSPWGLDLGARIQRNHGKGINAWINDLDKWDTVSGGGEIPSESNRRWQAHGGRSRFRCTNIMLWLITHDHLWETRSFFLFITFHLSPQTCRANRNTRKGTEMFV